MKEIQQREAEYHGRRAELIVFVSCFSMYCSKWFSKSKQIKKKLQRRGPNYTTIHLSRDNAAWFSGFIKTVIPTVPAVFQEATFLFLRTILDWGSTGQDDLVQKEELYNTFWKWALSGLQIRCVTVLQGCSHDTSQTGVSNLMELLQWFWFVGFF